MVTLNVVPVLQGILIVVGAGICIGLLALYLDRPKPKPRGMASYKRRHDDRN